MIRALILTAFIASPAFAGNTADFQGTGCTLVPVSGQAHVAELHCSNTHTSGAAFTEGAMTADGLTVNVAILHGPGDIPDQFSFAPMPGFYADPPSMMLDEHTSGVVLIFEYVGS